MSPDELQGKVVLVTGASGGIGSAIAAELATHAATLALAYGRNVGAAQALAAQVIHHGGRAITSAADLRQADAPDQLVDAVEAAVGPVDILVANAASGTIASYEQVDGAMFDEMLNINLRAPYLLARRVLPGMLERQFGRIIFMSSVAAFTGGIVGPHYAASKAGLHGLTHYLASRTAARGVTVNAIAPALIGDTGMLPGDEEQLAASIPIGRVGTPVEVAKLTVAVLLNDYLTNQVISIDGGIHPR